MEKAGSWTLMAFEAAKQTDAGVHLRGKSCFPSRAPVGMSLQGLETLQTARSSHRDINAANGLFQP